MRLAAVLAVLSFALACGDSDDPEAAPPATPDDSAVAEDAEDAGAQGEVPFGYVEGAGGPDEWGSLSDEYAACGAGTEQSPIDLSGAEERDLADVTFDYVPGEVTLRNTTHTVQADQSTGSAIEVDGDRFDLIQFHFHEPSEHSVDGELLDGELHLVHRDDAGGVTVVSVLLRAGEANTALEPIFASLPEEPGATATVADVDPGAFLPTDRRSFRYEGSLTTPPCTEGVGWVVLREPVDVSAFELEAFRSVIEANARPTQGRGSRPLALDAS